MFGFDCGLGPKSEVMRPDYIIEKYKHGWALRGAGPHRRGIPMDALTECLAMFPKDSVMDAGISNALGAVVAVGTPDACKEWRAAIEAELEASPLHPELKWLRGTDTGMSSKTIFRVLARPIALNELLDHEATLPSDSGDFGRCHRLVQRFEWRNRLHEVAAKLPQWGALIGKWDELTALLVANKNKELYDLIQLCTKPNTSTK